MIIKNVESQLENIIIPSPIFKVSKNLLQKFQTSEETTMEDIKNLNSFVKEGKKNLNKKPINLKDDYDEQEDQNNNDNKNNNN